MNGRTGWISVWAGREAGPGCVAARACRIARQRPVPGRGYPVMSHRGLRLRPTRCRPSGLGQVGRKLRKQHDQRSGKRRDGEGAAVPAEHASRQTGIVRPCHLRPPEWRFGSARHRTGRNIRLAPGMEWMPITESALSNNKLFQPGIVSVRVTLHHDMLHARRGRPMHGANRRYQQSIKTEPRCDHLARVAMGGGRDYGRVPRLRSAAWAAASMIRHARSSAWGASSQPAFLSDSLVRRHQLAALGTTEQQKASTTTTMPVSCGGSTILDSTVGPAISLVDNTPSFALNRGEGPARDGRTGHPLQLAGGRRHSTEPHYFADLLVSIMVAPVAVLGPDSRFRGGSPRATATARGPAGPRARRVLAPSGARSGPAGRTAWPAAAG